MKETKATGKLSHKLFFEVMSIQENEPSDLFSLMLYDSKQLALFNPESFPRALRYDKFGDRYCRHWFYLVDSSKAVSEAGFTARPIIRF
jgi:hypothetical protein